MHDHPPADYPDPDAPDYTEQIGRRILANEELVQAILESAQEMGAPMTAEEFLASLREEKPETGQDRPG